MDRITLEPGKRGGRPCVRNLRITAAPASDLTAGKPVALQGGVADYSQDGYPVTAAIDGDPNTGWAVNGQPGRPHVAVFETAADTGVPGGTVLSLVLEQGFGGQHTLGRFRVSVTTAPRPVKFDALPVAITEIVTLAPDKRSAEQQTTLTTYFKTLDPEWSRLNAMVETARQAHSQYRLQGAQDLAWALVNSPAFLFNR